MPVGSWSGSASTSTTSTTSASKTDRPQVHTVTVSPKPAGGLATGAKVGIGVGVAGGVCVLTATVAFCILFRRRRSQNQSRGEGESHFPEKSPGWQGQPYPPGRSPHGYGDDQSYPYLGVPAVIHEAASSPADEQRVRKTMSPPPTELEGGNEVPEMESVSSRSPGSPAPAYREVYKPKKSLFVESSM